MSAPTSITISKGSYVLGSYFKWTWWFPWLCGEYSPPLEYSSVRHLLSVNLMIKLFAASSQNCLAWMGYQALCSLIGRLEHCGYSSHTCMCMLHISTCMHVWYCSWIGGVSITLPISPCSFLSTDSNPLKFWSLSAASMPLAISTAFA